MASKLTEIFKGRKAKSMCLDNAGLQTLTPSTVIESGWKEFSGATKEPEFQAYSLNGTRKVPLDRWITAVEGPAEGGTKYTAGFHIYCDESEKVIKNKFGKRRVYFRNAHTRGRQGTASVIIAKEMYVPSDPDAWPPRS